jgi:hypothetical protein
LLRGVTGIIGANSSPASAETLPPPWKATDVAPHARIPDVAPRITGHTGVDPSDIWCRSSANPSTSR